MEILYSTTQDNLSFSPSFDEPDFSEYYIDASLYTNHAEDYSLDVGDGIRVFDKQKTSESYIISYNNIFDKYMDKDKNLSNIPLGLEFDNDDASWVMACTFLMFTLHTGYGLIECGLCGKKNQVNILIRNAMTVLFSGFAFWCVGFAIVYGYVM